MGVAPKSDVLVEAQISKYQSEKENSGKFSTLDSKRLAGIVDELTDQLVEQNSARGMFCKCWLGHVLEDEGSVWYCNYPCVIFF